MVPEKVSEPVSKKISTGKKSRNRSRKNLVLKKSLGFGIVQILGLVTRPQRYEEFNSGTVRYGIFSKSRYTGTFRYGISHIFSYRNFWKLFGISVFMVQKVINLECFHNCLSFCINASCPRNISSSSI